jgi:phosphinothricin acetyltransferase
MTVIRDATSADIHAITDIYNALIPTTSITWSEALQTPEERGAWFANQQRQNFPVLVATDSNTGSIIGFASYTHFRGAGIWPGYRFTVEHTIHVRQQNWEQGIGRTLILELIERARSAGIHVMVGALDGANASSLSFHDRLGFVEVGRMPEVGFKFGRRLDLVLVQKILE